MEISVSLRVSRSGPWSSIADKSASLEMPVTEDEDDWKETVKDKLQFFMQEAAEMLIPAVKKAVDSYENPVARVEADELPPAPAAMKEQEEVQVPGGDANASGSVVNPFAE